MNRVIEQARAGKLVGASLDGKVYLYVSAPDLQQSLTSLSGSSEGVDALHRIFLTSQVPTHSLPWENSNTAFVCLWYRLAKYTLKSHC